MSTANCRPTGSEAVAGWLAAHPDEAALVAAWRRAGRSHPRPLRRHRQRAGAGAAQARPNHEAGSFRQPAAGLRIAAAACLAAFLIGGGAGWIAHGAVAGAPNSFDTITADALEAYKLYVVEVRHPVEVPGNERPHMTAWLTKRLGYQQHIPDLQAMGLKLVGGRLLPGPTGSRRVLYV